MEEYVYQFHLNPDPGEGIDIKRLRSVRNMADRYFGNFPPEKQRAEVEKLINGWNTERTWYEIGKPCLTCGQHPAKPIIPEGELDAVYYCDKCRPPEAATV